MKHERLRAATAHSQKRWEQFYTLTTDSIRERIWRIADGVPLKLDNMTIRATDSGKLLVTGWTSAIQFENVNREKVSRELEDLKASFSELTKSFSELSGLVKSNQLIIEFHMAYDDSGKVGIGLCSEIEGTINWYIK